MVDYERTFKLAKCNNEHYRDWSSLPADILRDISLRLVLLDYRNFANVCAYWRSVTEPLSSKLPFVFLHQYCFLDEPKPYCKLLNLSENRSNNVHMPILDGKVCIGSQHGWLVVVDNTVDVIWLYNPFSLEVIKLPCHAPLVLSHDIVIHVRKNVRKVVLSCAPISSTAPLPAAAALLYGSSAFLYKRDGQSSWKCLVPQDYFLDVTWWRGKFVGVTRKGAVFKLDLDLPEPNFKGVGFGSSDFLIGDKYNKHLINLDDDLLLVWWRIDSQSVQTRSTRFSTVTVKVMQLDPQSLFWIPVNDLRGHSLFLGTSHSFALSSQHIAGLKDNLIYFIQDLWGHRWDPSIYRTDWKRDIRVFNMRTGTYEICVLPDTPLLPSMFDDLCGHSTTSAFWYVPPLSELQMGSF